MIFATIRAIARYLRWCVLVLLAHIWVNVICVFRTQYASLRPIALVWRYYYLHYLRWRLFIFLFTPCVHITARNSCYCTLSVFWRSFRAIVRQNNKRDASNKTRWRHIYSRAVRAKELKFTRLLKIIIRVSMFKSHLQSQYFPFLLSFERIADKSGEGNFISEELLREKYNCE